MFSNNSKISVRQISRMLVFDLFSISSLIIPYIASKGAGRDGIISIIIGTALALLYAYIMIWFGKKAEKDYIHFSKRTVGSIITFFFGVLYCFKLFFSCVFSVGLFGQIINETLLTDTNYKIIIFVILFVAAYAAYKGIEVRARIAEILYFIVLVPIFLAFLIGLTKIDLSNIAPLFTEPGNNIMSSSYLILLTYSAIEFIILEIPLVNKDRKVVKQVSKSVLVVGTLNILMFIVTVGIIGVYGAKEKLWSAVSIMQVIEMPGGFVQRQDGIIIALFIVSIFIIISTFIYYLSAITSKIINVKDFRFFIIPFAILIFFVAATFIDMEPIFDSYLDYMMYIGFPQSILIPLIIIFVDFIKRKGRNKSDNMDSIGKDELEL